MNLLDALSESLRAGLANVWRRRVLALGVAWTAALAAAAIIPFVPERYEASARLYVDTQSVLRPLMAGLAYEPDIDLQLRMLARNVISRPNIEKMLERQDLGLQSLAAEGREKAISRLMDRIKLAPVDVGNLYAVSYRDTDRERARRVVAAIVDLFVGSSSREKRRDSEDASQFIEKQIKENEAKLVEAENRLKEYKLRHFGVSGVSNQDYFARISSLSDQLEKLRADLRAAEQTRDTYQRELNAENPLLPVVSEASTALEAQKRRLADLLVRFTESHPDVVSARSQIAALEAQKRSDLEAAGGADAARRVAATSPVYQRIRVSLAESESLVSSLRSRVAANQQKLDEARVLGSQMPQAEAELAQLNRDYDVIHKNYDQLVSRRESASLGLRMDESSQMADFQLVEPPRVSPSPVFPARVPLSLLAIVASILLGLLAPAVASGIRPTFLNAQELRLASGRPVLGTISISQGDRAPRGPTGARFRSALALLMLLLLQSGWLAWVATRPMA